MLLKFLLSALVSSAAWGAQSTNVEAGHVAISSPMQKRWLFVWRNVDDPKEVERMIARFPAAAPAGYNGVAFSHDVAPTKATELTEAAKRNKLELIAIVMGGAKDR